MNHMKLYMAGKWTFYIFGPPMIFKQNQQYYCIYGCSQWLETNFLPKIKAGILVLYMFPDVWKCKTIIFPSWMNHMKLYMAGKWTFYIFGPPMIFKQNQQHYCIYGCSQRLETNFRPKIKVRILDLYLFPGVWKCKTIIFRDSDTIYDHYKAIKVILMVFCRPNKFFSILWKIAYFCWILRHIWHFTSV